VTSTYEASVLPAAEFDVLACAACEERPFTLAKLRSEYELLSSYSDRQLLRSTASLIQKRMLGLSIDKLIFVTKYGHAVIQFAENTRRKAP